MPIFIYTYSKFLKFNIKTFVKSRILIYRAPVHIYSGAKVFFLRQKKKKQKNFLKFCYCLKFIYIFVLKYV